MRLVAGISACFGAGRLPFDNFSFCRDPLQELVQFCAVADEACDQLAVLDVDATGANPETDEQPDFYFNGGSLLEESSSL